MKSNNGLNLKQGDLELKVYDLKRDIERNRAYVNGELQTLFPMIWGILVYSH